MDEVWLSQEPLKGLDKTDSREFADLLVHEILLAIRVLKFESEEKKCLITAPDIRYCENQDKSRSGTVLDLAPSDYSLIREAGSEFF